MATFILFDGYFHRYMKRCVIPNEILNMCIRFYLVLNIYPNFQAGDSVLIQHQAGGYLSSTIYGNLSASKHTMRSSKWIIGKKTRNNRIQLWSNISNRYLCIVEGNQVVTKQCYDRDQRYSLFDITFYGTSNSQIMLESVEYPRRFIGVTKNNIIQCRNGDKLCRLKLIHKYGEPEWRKPYLFDKTRVVVIEVENTFKGYVPIKHYLRVCATDPEKISSDQNKGILSSQWAMFPYDDDRRVRIRSMKTGKYLRVIDNGNLGVDGNGDKFCQFIVHQYGEKNEIELQSMELQTYIGVGYFGAICCGKKYRLQVFQQN
eukprot:33885_1